MDTNRSLNQPLMTAKVVCVGESSIGKTSLVQRYTDNTYSEIGQQPTVAADFKTKNVTINPENGPIDAQEIVRL